MSDFITVAELRIEAERLCDENERLEAENAELRNDADLLRAMWSQERTEKRYYMAENAKLREDNDRFIQAIEDLHDVSLEDELVRLENENAKLREVGRAAWRCIHTGASCYDCRLIAGGCTLQTAMRELGVEI